MILSPKVVAPPVAQPWFKGVVGSFKWSQAAQRLWEWLKDVRHNGQVRFFKKDWELAAILNVGRRCIQAGLWFLEHVAKVIRRWKQYGHNGGRVIEIVINLATAKDAPTATAGKAEKAKPGKSSPAAPPASQPESVAPPASAADDAELTAEAAEVFAASKARREAEAAAQAARKARKSTPRPPTPATRSPGVVSAQEVLEAHRRQLGIAIGGGPGIPPDPSGP
jgi:hypothetical protein